jgi:hypothetical protein
MGAVRTATSDAGLSDSTPRRLRDPCRPFRQVEAVRRRASAYVKIGCRNHCDAAPKYQVLLSPNFGESRRARVYDNIMGARTVMAE